MQEKNVRIVVTMMKVVVVVVVGVVVGMVAMVVMETAVARSMYVCVRIKVH